MFFTVDKSNQSSYFGDPSSCPSRKLTEIAKQLLCCTVCNLNPEVSFGPSLVLNS